MTLEKYPDIVERLTENDANEVVKDHARLYEKYKDIQGLSDADRRRNQNKDARL